MFAPVKAKRLIAGVSLIEMLVALLVLSFGLLGLAGLQAHSLRNNTSAFFRTQANAMAFDIMDRMRANRSATLCGGSYNVTVGGSFSGRPPVAQTDLTEWRATLAQLPSGTGGVACTQTGGLCPNSPRGTCVVRVQWDDTRGLSPPQQFVLSAEL